MMTFNFSVMSTNFMHVSLLIIIIYQERRIECNFNMLFLRISNLHTKLQYSATFEFCIICLKLSHYSIAIILLSILLSLQFVTLS